MKNQEKPKGSGFPNGFVYPVETEILAGAASWGKSSEPRAKAVVSVYGPCAGMVMSTSVTEMLAAQNDHFHTQRI